MGLLYMLTLWSNMCYMGLKFNGCFVTGVALTSDHYRMEVINGVGYPRSDSIVPLVLCTVAYNIWGTDVVLHVPWNSANPTENG
jgi:hypothetical protein